MNLTFQSDHKGSRNAQARSGNPPVPRQPLQFASKNQFRVLVVPDEDSPPWPTTKFLRQGTRANGWVLLDQVGLGYEVWRRLNGFPPSIAYPELSGDGGKKDKNK